MHVFETMIIHIDGRPVKPFPLNPIMSIIKINENSPDVIA